MNDSENLIVAVFFIFGTVFLAGFGVLIYKLTKDNSSQEEKSN